MSLFPEQVKGAGAKRVARTAIHAILETTIMSWIAFDHFLCRNPARPFALRIDCSGALKFQSLLAHRNAITPSGRRGFNEVEETLFRVDHDGARLIASEGYFLRPKLWIDTVLIGFYRVAVLGNLFLFGFSGLALASLERATC